MSRAFPRHLTKSRIGVAVCVALIAFGVVSAVLPHHAGPRRIPTAVPSDMAGVGVADVPSIEEPAQLMAAQQTAAQQVAVGFVTACDTTNPAQPEGDVATEAALAPGLVVARGAAEPATWRTEDRTTTVALNPPGQPVAERGGTVAVIVTGIVTVSSDAGPPQLVPIVERITLHPINDDHFSGDHWAGDRGATGWQVVGVEVGP
jgi:hypothetical protein